MTELACLIRDLKCCNLGIDVWQSSRAYVTGFREQQLSYFYGQRDITLDKLKAYQWIDRSVK
ncbi:hypothetical protein LCGC14_3134900 [marine sediment metagenome]|uniref:Uncharacterized protein n=1 Tax=marine sediment metagenome TaxID=412755 RepID=A0A0F8WMJ1_9ZZZZ